MDVRKSESVPRRRPHHSRPGQTTIGGNERVDLDRPPPAREERGAHGSPAARPAPYRRPLEDSSSAKLFLGHIGVRRGDPRPVARSLAIERLNTYPMRSRLSTKKIHSPPTRQCYAIDGSEHEDFSARLTHSTCSAAWIARAPRSRSGVPPRIDLPAATPRRGPGGVPLLGAEPDALSPSSVCSA